MSLELYAKGFLRHLVLQRIHFYLAACLRTFRLDAWKLHGVLPERGCI